MSKRINILVLQFSIILFLTNGCDKNEKLDDSRNEDKKAGKTKQEDIQYVRDCGKRWANPITKISGPPPEEIKKVAAILKKFKMTKTDVIDLLGEPVVGPNTTLKQMNIYGYTLTDSSVIFVVFNSDGIVTNVDIPDGYEGGSDVTPSKYWMDQVIRKTKSEVKRHLDASNLIKETENKWKYTVNSEVFELSFGEKGTLDSITKLDENAIK